MSRTPPMMAAKPTVMSQVSGSPKMTAAARAVRATPLAAQMP
jgi:hypothetical protein